MTSGSTDCPSSDQLARFVDAVCSDSERESLIPHLDACPSCRGVVVDAVRFNELNRNTPSRRTAWLRRTAVLAAGGAVAAALVLLISKLPVLSTFPEARTPTVSLLAASIGSARLAELSPDWSDKDWTVARGGQGPLSYAEAAFRLGARAVDLNVALARNESRLAESLTYEMTDLLENVPLSEPFVLSYETLREQAAAGDSSDALTLSARTAELLERHLEEPFFEFGVWTEASLVAAQVGASELLTSGVARLPTFEEGARSETVSRRVARILALLGEPPNASDLAEIEASLRDIVSVSGGPVRTPR